MTLLEFLLLLIVAALCGGIAAAIGGARPMGCILSIVLGFVGAWFGRWLAGALGLPIFFQLSVAGKSFPLIWTIIGGALIAAIFSAIFWRSPRYYRRTY